MPLKPWENSVVHLSVLPGFLGSRLPEVIEPTRTNAKSKTAA